MQKYFLGLFGLLLVAIGGFYYYQHRASYNFSWDQIFFSKGTINISSQDFAEGSAIPSQFTCDGLGNSPVFFLNNVPTDSKSLVIILEDESTSPKPFTHWIAYNLNPNISVIESAKVLGNSLAGTNDYGNAEYDGPCPPYGRTHKYYFRVYALNTTLDIQNPNRTALGVAISGHIIATGYLSGVYTKNP